MSTSAGSSKGKKETGAFKHSDKGKTTGVGDDPEDHDMSVEEEEDNDDDDDDDEDDEGEEEEDEEDEEEDLSAIDPSVILSSRTRRKPPVDYTDPEVIKKAGLSLKDMDEE